MNAHLSREPLYKWLITNNNWNDDPRIYEFEAESPRRVKKGARVLGYDPTGGPEWFVRTLRIHGRGIEPLDNTSITVSAMLSKDTNCLIPSVVFWNPGDEDSIGVELDTVVHELPPLWTVDYNSVLQHLDELEHYVMRWGEELLAVNAQCTIYCDDNGELATVRLLGANGSYEGQGKVSKRALEGLFLEVQR